MNFIKNKLAIVLIILLFLSAGCSLIQEIHFNKDFSGTYKFTYDFSNYLEIVKEEVTEDSLLLSEEDFQVFITNLEVSLDNINGISNLIIKNNTKSGIISVSFNFADLNSLNESLVYTSAFESENLDMPLMWFEQKRRRLFLKRNKLEIPPPEDRETMNEMFTQKIILSFEKTPKKITAPKQNIKIMEEGRLIVEEGGFYSIYGKDVEYEFCFNRLFCILGI